MKKLLLLIALILFCFESKSQIRIIQNDTAICNPASLFFSVRKDSIVQNAVPAQDDKYNTSITPLGFSFRFFGDTYDSCLFSTNFYLLFGRNSSLTPLLNTFSPWPGMNGALPNNGARVPTNAIFPCWLDLYPISQGDAVCVASYKTFGSAPNRMFVFDFCNVPLFSMRTGSMSGQVKLFETSNRIEFHILRKDSATSGTSIYNIQGLQNKTGTVAYTVPGRNNTNWSARYDAWQFEPADPACNTYTVARIPFNYTTMLSGTTQWYVNGTYAGNGDTLRRTISVNSNVVARLNGCGDAASDTVTVKIGIPSTVRVTQINCPDAVFGGAQVSIDASQRCILRWKQGNQLVQLDSPYTRTATFNTINPGKYYIYYESMYGCTKVDSFTLTKTNLTDSLFSVNQTCRYTQDGQIILNPNGIGPFTYAWTSDTISSVTRSKPSNDTLQNLPAGRYWVTATNSIGCSVSDSATISKPNHQISFSHTPDSICERVTPVLFRNTSTGLPIVKSNWSFGDTTTSAVHIFPRNGRDSVTLITTYTQGCRDTLTQVFTVKELGSRVQYSDTAGCVPYTFSLRDSSLADSVLIEWGDNTRTMLYGNYQATQLASHSFTGLGRINVIRTIFARNGCVSKDTQEIGVFNIPTAAFSYTDSALCNRHLVTLLNQSIDADSIRIDWGDGTIQVVSGIFNSSYQHIYSSSRVFQVSVTALRTYPNRLLCNDFISKPISIQIRPIPIPSVSTNTPARCVNDVFNAFNSGQNIDSVYFYWGDGQSTSGNPLAANHAYQLANTYSILMLAFSKEGCVDSARVSMEIFNKPTSKQQFISYQNCIPFNFKGIDSSDAERVFVQWDSGDTVTYYKPFSTLTHVYQKHGTFYPYFVALRYYQILFLCSDTTFFQVTTTGFDSSDKAPILVTSTENEQVLTRWNAFPTAKQYMVEKEIPGVANWYNVSITSDTFFVDILEKGDRRVNYRIRGIDSCGQVSGSLNYGGNIVLKEQSSNLDLAILTWNPYLEFEKGVQEYRIERVDFDQLSSPKVIINTMDTTATDSAFFDRETGGWCYRIEAVSQDSLISHSNQLCVAIPDALFIPTAFSPNGDGLNETWELVGRSIRSYQIRVFDRWGGEIWSGNQSQPGWDGRVNEKLLPTGAYSYTIEIFSRTGKRTFKSGLVSIVR